MAGILSFCSTARELASQAGRTCTAEGQAEAEVISKDDSSNGSWAYVTAMVSERADQLPAAIKGVGEVKLKGNAMRLA